MPQDSQGNYTPPASPIFPAEAGTLIRAEYFNAIIQDLANALNTTLLANGKRPMTGALVMNNNRITNVGFPNLSHEVVNVNALTQRAPTVFGAGQIMPDTYKFQALSGGAIKEYVSGQIFVIPFLNYGEYTETDHTALKFQVDSLAELDLVNDLDAAHTLWTIGGGGLLIVRVVFNGVKLVARVHFNTSYGKASIAKPSRQTSTAASQDVGTYQNLGMSLDKTNAIYYEGLRDLGEVVGNGYAMNLGSVSGTYQVASNHGRGLYVLRASSSNWSGRFGFFCEPGAGTIVLPNPLNQTTMGFGSAIQFPTGAAYFATLHKIF